MLAPRILKALWRMDRLRIAQCRDRPVRMDPILIIAGLEKARACLRHLFTERVIREQAAMGFTDE